MTRTYSTVLLAGLLLLILAVWGQAYTARKDLVDAQRRGCERSKIDRSDNAKGWWRAEQARRSSGSPSDLVAAREYHAIHLSLDARSRIKCAEAFPSPSVLPWSR